MRKELFLSTLLALLTLSGIGQQSSITTKDTSDTRFFSTVQDERYKMKINEDRKTCEAKQVKLVEKIELLETDSALAGKQIRENKIQLDAFSTDSTSWGVTQAGLNEKISIRDKQIVKLRWVIGGISVVFTGVIVGTIYLAAITP